MKEQYWMCIIGPAKSDELNKFKGAKWYREQLKKKI